MSPPAGPIYRVIMSDVWGADLRGLEELRRSLLTCGERIGRIERSATAASEESQRFWAGPDAHDFRQSWNGTHRQALRSAVAALTQAAQVVADNRTDQARTSAVAPAGSAAVAAAVAASPTTTAESGATLSPTEPPTGYRGGTDPEVTTVLFSSESALGSQDDGGSVSEAATQINDLLSYGWFDWDVSGGEQRGALDLLLGSEDLPGLVAELDRRGDLDTVIARIEHPELRLRLLRTLGSELGADGRALVMPHVRDAGIEAEIQFHLGLLGLPITATEFDAEPYADLISDDAGDPFTGVGATGVNPQEEGVGLIDSIGLGLGLGEDKYGNPIGPLGAYLDGLTVEERHRQVELLVNQPISSEPTAVVSTGHNVVIIPGIADSYAGNLPARRDIIELAAARYDLEPELLTAVILAEQRDQSAYEDAKDYDAAASPLQGNTSIGLGQVVVSTAQNNDLFADLLSEETRLDLNHGQTAGLLASDEVNIFATARYIRQVADQGAVFTTETLHPNFERAFPGLDPEAYAGHSSTWPADNISALGSEYTSAPWDDGVFAAWGAFVGEAYRDVEDSRVFP